MSVGAPGRPSREELAGRLGILKRLSAVHGQTVVLVTHDRELAASASRVIELRDGRVVADAAGVASPV